MVVRLLQPNRKLESSKKSYSEQRPYKKKKIKDYEEETSSKDSK